jgi:diguanylate cyclase (GGDEF)-like protein/PAS domain S-box-containing protein
MGQPGSAFNRTVSVLAAALTAKGAFKLTLLAALVTLLFSALYFYQLQHRFTQHRLQLQQQQQQVIDLGLEQFSQQINRINRALLQNHVLDNLINTDIQPMTDSDFFQRWTSLIKIHQPAAIALYRVGGSALQLWPDATLTRAQQAFYRHWMLQLKRSGTPQQAIFCQAQDCIQYRFSMIPAVGSAIIAVTGVSIQPLLDRFNLGRHPTGLLTTAQDRDVSTNVLVYKWGYQLNSSANSKPLLQALTQLAQTRSQIERAQALFDIELDQRNLELASFPLLPGDGSLLVRLDDISQQKSTLFADTLKIAVLIFLILISAALAYLKRWPRRVLLADAESAAPPEVTLPAIDSGTKLSIDGNQTQPADTDGNLQLSSQLETLKQYNEEINQQLAQQMILLGEERDRARKILDHSQAIIMTLQQDGSIDSINQFGEKVTGFSSEELLGKNFIDLYPENNPVALKDLQTMSSVSKGLKTLYQHEANLNRKDGEECIIQWSHTRLDCPHRSAPLLLSTGLDITQHRKLERNLSWLVNHDTLTTLFNRRRFEKEVNAAMKWAKKHRANGILITIDLENFKDINDTCGHKVGDIILRKVASTLQALCRPIDSAAHKVTARIGGDEFAIILRGIDGEGGSNLSQRIIKALNGISHFQHQISFQLSASIGIASFSDAHNNATELLSNANYARNQAKIDGRNHYRVFNPQHSHIEQTHHRMIWRDRIENALRNDRFVLHFQPILDIQKNKISHYETLIRMLDENNELIAPGLFIHIAEQFGLIQQIDDYIIASAIARQGALVTEGHDLTLTINLSAKAFDDKKLYHKISQAIRDNHANAEHLVFEITETGAVSNIVAAQEIMTQIQALGCKFALDDFGVGFSSFHYLRKLPVDLVKIDGSFVTDLAKHADNKVLVKALSEVAIGFNKETVAEFVDSLQTLEILKNSSVNYAQGYFIGKPGADIPVPLPPELIQFAGNPAQLH